MAIGLSSIGGDNFDPESTAKEIGFGDIDLANTNFGDEWKIPLER